MTRARTMHLLWLLAVVTIILSVPLIVRNDYLLSNINIALIYAVLVCGLNIVFGFCGQISMASNCFWGLGAYTSVLLVMKAKVPFPIAFLVSPVIPMIFGMVLGFPALKLRRFYLSICTIGFAQVIGLVLQNWTSLTNGIDGIPGIPKPTFGAFVVRTHTQFFYFLLACCVLTFYVVWAIRNSRIGRAFVAIREDEVAASAMGINLLKYKVLAFALSAAPPGLAGALFAHRIGYINPEPFRSFEESIVMLSMLVVGGTGTIIGPLLGAFLLFLTPEILRFLKEYYIAAYGLLLIFTAIKMPGGVAGVAERALPVLLTRLRELRLPSAPLGPQAGSQKGGH